MTDFEFLVAPHRVARLLPLAERYAAAVDWAENRMRDEFPDADAIAKKIQRRITLSDNERAFAFKALSRKNAPGQPKTREGRDLMLRLTVNLVAKEFNLSPTRGNMTGKRGEIGHRFSAADVIAAAMSRLGVAPRSFERVMKVRANAKSEELAIAAEYFQKQEMRQEAISDAFQELIRSLKRP